MQKRNTKRSIRARAPKASSEKVHFVMQRNVGRETDTEKILRSALHRNGLRFRKEFCPIPNLKITVDIVFPKQKMCIFIDGCFWHGCPYHFKLPGTNSDWWREKIEDNKLRDKKQTEILENLNWLVFRFWEHDITKENLDNICLQIQNVVKNRASQTI